jgi:hypothetical protein
MCHHRTRRVFSGIVPPAGHLSRLRPGEAPHLSRRDRLGRGEARGGTPVWFAALLAVLMLVATGIAYRTAMAHTQGGAVEPVRLPVPLKQFPLRIGDWAGEDVPLVDSIAAYMRQNFADDYVNRHYADAARQLMASVYVVYCSSKPGGILGHRPGICFVNNGWIHDVTEPSEIISSSGRPISCLIHRFHKPAPTYQEIVVLSFYVLNGQITVSESGFSNIWGRRPNISGDLARYVAQVQVSSGLEHSVRTAAAEMADTILTFLPDSRGEQAVARLREFTPAGKKAENSK